MSVQATGSHQKEQTLLYLQTDWQSKHVQTSVFAKPHDPTRCTALAASHDALMGLHVQALEAGILQCQQL